MRESLLLLLLTGCLSPRYHRPEPAVGSDWPTQVAPDQADPADEPAQVATDPAGWREAFPDPGLQDLVQRALDHNQDLRATILNVDAARAQLQLATSQLGPQISLDAKYTNNHVPASVSPFGEAYTVEQFSIGPAVSWELDVFGRLRASRRAQAQRTFAAAEDWRAARIALIAQVVRTALQERVLAHQLELADQALKDRREASELVGVQVDAGLVSELDLRAAQALVASAEASRAAIERSRLQTHNALVELVGEPVALLAPAGPGLDGMVARVLPSGVPSELLVRRPDVRAMERRLIASHADIGAARAAFFPRISLTGNAGAASAELLSLFDPGTLAWSIAAPSLTQPIFGFGQNLANLKSANIAREAAVADYQASIQSAFREVADVLVAWSTYRDHVDAQGRALEAQQARVAISNDLYAAGSVDYLTVLDAERERFAAEQALMDVQLQQAQLAVTWFAVLGGGAEADVELPSRKSRKERTASN